MANDDITLLGGVGGPLITTWMRWGMRESVMRCMMTPAWLLMC